MAAAQLAEYLGNIRALLRQDPNTFRIMVERQVLARLLPRLRGSRAALEPGLWELLVFCLDGHEAPTPAMDDEAYERARQAAEGGRALQTEQRAAFPRAAVAVLRALGTLREVGVYPPPKL